MIPNASTPRVLIIRGQSQAGDPIDRLLEANGLFIYHYTDPLQALAQIYNEPPDCILLSTTVPEWEDFVRRIKSDLVYGHLPLLLIAGRYSLKTMQRLTSLPVDDVVIPPIRPEEILLRVHLRLTQANRDLDANPLTRLPGNLTILSTLQQAIDRHVDFALGWVDLDHFKSFNDRYGFSRGDELIRMTARILTNTVRRLAPSDSFVGHVGGDDFIFQIPPDLFEEVCKQIIQHFDMTAHTLVNDEDRIRGYFEGRDRQGKMQRFSLPSLSIAGIDSRLTRIQHPGEAAAIAGEVKKHVKKLKGSNYMMNRRSAAPPEPPPAQ